MDTNEQLILAKATGAEKWEDREKASDDVKALMEEFDKRLPAGKTDSADANKNGKVGTRN